MNLITHWNHTPKALERLKKNKQLRKQRQVGNECNHWWSQEGNCVRCGIPNYNCEHKFDWNNKCMKCGSNKLDVTNFRRR